MLEEHAQPRPMPTVNRLFLRPIVMTGHQRRLSPQLLGRTDREMCDVTAPLLVTWRFRWYGDHVMEAWDQRSYELRARRDLRPDDAQDLRRMTDQEDRRESSLFAAQLEILKKISRLMIEEIERFADDQIEFAEVRYRSVCRL